MKRLVQKFCTYFQNELDCNKNIVDYNEDDPCLVNEIRYWQHGKLHPMGNYSFYSKTPQLDGQIGVPPFVDKILSIENYL